MWICIRSNKQTKWKNTTLNAGNALKGNHIRQISQVTLRVEDVVKSFAVVVNN